MGGFYDTEGLNNERFLILSDMQQEMPASRLKVVDRAERTAASGKTYPTLTLEDVDGNKYIVAAYKRDCRECIKEWGGEPKDWGHITISKGATRYSLVPAKNQSEAEIDV